MCLHESYRENDVVYARMFYARLAENVTDFKKLLKTYLFTKKEEENPSYCDKSNETKDGFNHRGKLWNIKRNS